MSWAATPSIHPGLPDRDALDFPFLGRGAD
jgi:hypothetical protein